MRFRYIGMIALALAVAACVTTPEKRVFKITWLESGDTFVGELIHKRGALRGSTQFTIYDQDCEGRWWMVLYPRLKWEATCDGGLSARGEATALGGRQQAARGIGIDSFGRKVNLFIGIAGR